VPTRPTDDIIQQADEVCDAVLDHDGDCNGERHFLKRRISDVFLSERWNATPLSSSILSIFFFTVCLL